MTEVVVLRQLQKCKITIEMGNKHTPQSFPGGFEVVNRIQAIRVFAVRVTPIFANKNHALKT
jgi:hypothetical protein